MSAPASHDPMVVNTKDWDMWCRICHIRPTSHRTEAEALEAADRHVKLQHAPQAEVHKLMAADGLAEIERLRAQVAELKAKRADEHDELALALGRSNGTEWGDLIEFAAGAVSVEAKWERHRAELTALRNDALNMRGALSPMGEARKVPMPLGETLLPAVEWLIGRVAELEAERHTTNEALSDAAEALRADRDRIAQLEAELRIGTPWTCHVCSKPNTRDVCVICETDRPEEGPSVEVSADKLTRLLAPTQAYREDEPAKEAGQHVEWCTGCNTDHDPDQCGYRPETGGAQ